MVLRYRLISIILVPILLGIFIQDVPKAGALYEYESLNNVLPTDYSLRMNSELLDLSSAGISYNPETVRVIIKGIGSIESIADKVHVSHQLKTKDGYLAFGATTTRNLPMLKSQGLEIKRDVNLEFDQIKDASRLGEILGSEVASKDHGLTGKGVKVAIVDTGTDFSNVDLMHAVARDVNRRPIMLDADGQGIVLTKTKFIANVTPLGNLLNSTLPEDEDEYTGNVYITDDGIFLNLSHQANGTKFEVYNSIYPLISPLIINATSNKNWKIGESTEDFIHSMSGEYKMGFVLQVQFHLGRAGLIIIPVLVVDSDKPGVYDTVIADMSSAWADFTKHELRNNQDQAEFDYSFTDEKRIKLGDREEFLAYDADDDGNFDLTAGMVGAHVLDVWGAIKEEEVEVDRYIGVVNGTLLKPLDPDGNYFGVMFDFLGHGTGSAASVASSGDDLYDVYKNSTKYNLKGVAPNAKIIPVKALWYGDVVYGWLWVSGFDQDKDGNWKYTGRHSADIINNSWGVSTFPVLDYGPGYDVLSFLSSLLSVPGAIGDEFPGKLMVNSAGNTGFGYGTLGSPSSAPFALTVGATTNNVFVGYDFTMNEPRFGNSTTHYDDIAGFSSRGPSMLGDVKPEVMSIGAYGFVPMPPNTKHLENATGAFGLFGGTSMAAPLAAGTAALVMEALRNETMEVNPFIVKSILMSTADDLRGEPFVQGAGRVNATTAAEYIKGMNGKFLVYTNDTYSNIVNLLKKSIDNYEIMGLGNQSTSVPKGNQTLIIPDGNYTLSFPERNLQDSKWYAGYVNRGESKETTLQVVNRSDKGFTVNLKATALQLIKQKSINGTTEVREKDPLLNDTNKGFAPNYVKLDEMIPEDTEIMIVKAYFPFESFQNSTEMIYANSLRIASLYFYDWNDKNEDEEVSFDELSMVNRGGSWGTVQEVMISDPTSRIKNTPLLGVYPVPTIYSYWSGDTRQNSTALNYTLSVAFYKKGDWDLLSLDTENIEMAPNSQRVFQARLDVPEDAVPGIYQGFITVESKTHTTNIPVSYVVPITVTSKDIPLVVSGEPRNDLLYDNASITGSFNMLSRYTAGDWRYYHFNITDATINAINMKITWKNNWTSVNAMMTDPSGKIIASSVPAGVFKVFLGWPSNDWLGTTRYSEGGGFYPASNHGNTTTVLYVPVNSTGIHTLMLHTTLFHGKELMEPIMIESKFTTLLPDTKVPEMTIEFPEYVRDLVEIPIDIVDENLEDVTYSINGSERVSLGENRTIILDTRSMVEGYHRLSIVASDTVGHTVYEDLIFAVDNTDPEVSIRSPEYGSVVAGSFDVISDVFDSTLKVFTVTLPNGTRIDDDKSLTIDTVELTDGKYDIVVTAEDGAGNLAEETVEFKVDNTAPLVSIINPSDGETVAGILNVEYDVMDENLNNVTIVMGGRSIDSGDSGSYEIDTTTLFDKEYVLEVIAEDRAGNIGSTSVKMVTENMGPTLLSAQEEGIEIGTKIGIEKGLLMGLIVGLAIGGGATGAVLLVKHRKRTS